MQLIFYILFLVTGAEIFSQTLPELYNLSEEKYEFIEWSMNAKEGTYPPNMIFHQTTKIDPKLDDEMTSDWILPYNLTSGSRIIGEDTLGIIFINTSVKNDEGGYLGAAVLGLSTKNCTNISVSWTGITNEPNDRVYSIALQYKIGDSEYKNTGVVYMMQNKRGDSKIFSDILLPEECEDKDSVYLRWKYFFTANDEGERAKLGIDDIVITSETIAGANDDFAEGIIIEQMHNQIFINSRYSDKCKVAIYSLTGELIFIDSAHLPFSYNIYPLAKGAYIIAAATNNKNKFHMFIR
jgi:hypothetical protein